MVRHAGGERFLLTNAPSGDVFILGAGFSRALSSHMPLTDELGNLAAERAGLDLEKESSDGRFEAWLSRLAEPQPDLTHMENIGNSVVFSKLQQAIHSTMVQRQETALSEGYPPWASEFVAALHASRATVVSFNYDLSIEWLFDRLGVWDFEGSERIGWPNLLGDLPPFPPIPARLSGSLRPSMQLLKLHGSLNWYWAPGDESGLTSNKWELRSDEGERRRYLPGRQPFIVPPTALKTAYFSNPVVHEMWQQAAAALRGREEGLSRWLLDAAHGHGCRWDDYRRSC